MRLERNSAPLDLDLASCLGDEHLGWFIRYREQQVRRRFLLSAELVRECLGIDRSRVDSALSRIAAKHIDIPEPAVVRAYLLEHLDLLDIVVSASSAAAATFGEEAQLLLTIYRDPEIEDKYIALYVRQREYSDEFLDALHQIYNSYAPEMAGKSGWFQVTSDFASPLE